MPHYPCPNCCGKSTPTPSANCSHCNNEQVPPVVCVRVEGVQNLAAPLVQCECPENFNRTIWLPFIGVIGTDIEDIAFANYLDVQTGACYWHCNWEGDESGEAFTGCYNNPSSAENNAYLVVWGSAGDVLIKFILESGGVGGWRQDWQKTMDPGDLDCMNWDDLKLSPTGFGTHICDASTSEAFVTSRSIAIPTDICCRSNTVHCYPGSVPSQIKLVVEGFRECTDHFKPSINPFPFPGGCDRPEVGDKCCDNCEDLNGTYFLDLITDAEIFGKGAFYLGDTGLEEPSLTIPSCGWVVPINLCGFERILVAAGYVIFQEPQDADGLRHIVQYTLQPGGLFGQSSQLSHDCGNWLNEVSENKYSVGAITGLTYCTMQSTSGGFNYRHPICNGSLGVDNDEVKFTLSAETFNSGCIEE